MKPAELGALPARVQFVGNPKTGEILKGTAVRYTTQDGMRHYEVHTDRNNSNLLVHEDLIDKEK